MSYTNFLYFSAINDHIGPNTVWLCPLNDDLTVTRKWSVCYQNVRKWSLIYFNSFEKANTNTLSLTIWKLKAGDNNNQSSTNQFHSTKIPRILVHQPKSDSVKDSSNSYARHIVICKFCGTRRPLLTRGIKPRPHN